MSDPIVERQVAEDVRAVPIVDLPLAMVVITSIFLGISLLTNCIRAYVNFRRRSAGYDDGLVVFSQIAFIAVLGTTIQAALRGIGTLNENLNDHLLMESQKWYFMWIIAYLLSMVTLKTAVCVTLLRILPRGQVKMRIAVYVLLAIVWSAWAVDFMAVLLLCRPIEASWNSALVAEGKAECGAQEVLIIVSHLLTAASVVTDIGCTVLPGIMLWNTQMHKTSKLEIFALLSIASVASIATIVRAPYFARYSNPEDNLSYWCGYMLLFSNIEMGIGLFASSLPAVRRFYMMLFRPDHPLAKGSKPESHQLNNMGSSGPYAKGSAVRRDNNDPMDDSDGLTKGSNYRPGDWVRLEDEGSDKGILINADTSVNSFRPQGKNEIRVDQTFEVASHQGPRM